MADNARTQANRFVAIATPLGEDKLLAKAVTIREMMNRPFEIDAELLSIDKAIEFDKIIGQNVTIRMALGNGSTRYFNGIVSSFSYEGMQDDLSVYRARIVPAAWFLSRRSDCKIFQNMTPVAVIEAMLAKIQKLLVEKGLTGKYKDREYQVQYRETDLNFVDRLMEQEGISYFFSHDNGKHTMVLADNPGAYKEYPGFATIKFDAEGSKRADEFQGLTSFMLTQQVQPTSAVITDYDFKVPGKQMLSSHAITRKHGAADGEIFDYPGEYIEPADGEAYAKIRAQELQTTFEVAQATGNARGIAIGHKFKLDTHPRKDIAEKQWLVVSATHRIVGDSFGGAKQSSGGGTYNVSFSAIAADTLIRPARVTPKPTIPGPQTAVVVGVKNEEITVDEFGRVKVHFVWDRHGKGDENDSCSIRVSQGITGKGWGQIHIPRHGEEVIVEFLDGDPDRPIITGRVYNGTNAAPYKLPDNKTMSGFKTSTSKGGAGFNELRFEDKKGDEQVFLHGEKNIDIRNKNDWYELIGHDKHVKVMNDSNEEIKQDRYEMVKRDHVEEVGRDRNITVKGKQSHKITESLSLTVTKDVIEVFEANQSTVVTGDHYLKAANIVIEAGTNITLKVGGTSIAIAADGVAIKTDGTVKVEATGGIENKATGGDFKAEGINVQVKGSASGTVDGGGALTLKGGVVSVN